MATSFLGAVETDADDHEGAEAGNPSRAGVKSPVHAVQVQQRQHLHDLREDRHHGGPIELRNRTPSPVAGSTRRSTTDRGASISTAPTTVFMLRR
ncbi:MAG: hypothetical protein QOJ19_2355 [Acidimicrobiia bacterium]|jgi:hypothetical protein|nr:hypothetical protein [Acidimicrobiia bacterium]